MVYSLVDVPSADSLVGSQDVIGLFGLQGMYNHYFRPYIPESVSATGSSSNSSLVPPREPTIKNYVQGLPGLLEFAKSDESLLKLMHRSELDEKTIQPLPIERIKGRFLLRPGQVYNFDRALVGVPEIIPPKTTPPGPVYPLPSSSTSLSQQPYKKPPITPIPQPGQSFNPYLVYSLEHDTPKKKSTKSQQKSKRNGEDDLYRVNKRVKKA